MNITFIRHGNTNKAEHDEQRRLTELGIQQATAKGAPLFDNYGPFDLIFFSGVQRTLETTFHLAANHEPSRAIHALHDLYLPRDPFFRQELLIMFQKLGQLALRAYIEDEGATTITQYGGFVAGQIRELIESRRAQNVLVVGHAVLLNAVAHDFASGNDQVLDTVLGECEGIHLSQAGVELF